MTVHNFLEMSIVVWTTGFISAVSSSSSTFKWTIPQISFQAFTDVINTIFNNNISLSTVLVILLTITENPEILSLHACQQLGIVHGEKSSQQTGWLCNMSCAFLGKLGTATFNSLFFQEQSNHSENENFELLAEKLDVLIKALNLYPVNRYGRLEGELESIEHESIQVIPLLCSRYAQCQAPTCGFRALQFDGSWMDVPLVTLIKGTTIYTSAHIVHAKCSQCKRIYYADHICTFVHNAKQASLNF